MDNVQETEKGDTHLVFSIFVGLFAPLIATTFIRLSGQFENWYLLAISIIYFLAAVTIAYRSAKGFRIQVMIVYLLSPIGSFIDAAVDQFFYGSGRNLWGLEVIVLLMLAPIPLACGAVVGRILTKRKGS